MNKDNMLTRDAHTNDEAWMLEKINQNGMSIDNFSPREFLLAVNEETENRKAFGRTEYVRNVDDTEYVEINSFLVLDGVEDEFGHILLCDLVEKVKNNDKEQVFAFPSSNEEIFKEVGFEEISRESLPEVMKERLDEQVNRHGDSTVSLSAQTNKVSYEIDDNEDEYEKPNNVTSDDVEKMKDELDLEDNNTKYSV